MTLIIRRGSDSGAQALNTTDSTLKGVLGVKAMSMISEVAGKKEDAQHYTVIYYMFIEMPRRHSRISSFLQNLAATMAQTWRSSLTLDTSSSQWEQMYDLYADRLLGMELVEDTVCIQPSKALLVSSH